MLHSQESTRNQLSSTDKLMDQPLQSMLCDFHTKARRSSLEWWQPSYPSAQVMVGWDVGESFKATREPVKRKSKKYSLGRWRSKSWEGSLTVAWICKDLVSLQLWPWFHFWRNHFWNPSYTAELMISEFKRFGNATWQLFYFSSITPGCEFIERPWNTIWKVWD